MKTLTALVFLVGLTASAQTPSLQGASLDFDTLMSMHSLGGKVVMQPCHSIAVGFERDMAVSGGLTGAENHRLGMAVLACAARGPRELARCRGERRGHDQGIEA